MSITKPLIAEPAQEIYLPRPPNNREKYKYFGGPRRLVFARLLIASAGVLYGYIHVAAGHETRYLPLCLATGVAPIDFPSLANQQARWCRSSMMVMIDKHFVEAPYNWKQRAAFWAAFLYYMSSGRVAPGKGVWRRARPKAAEVGA